MSLPEISINRPVLATVLTLSLVLVGLVSLFRLNIDEYPNMSFPYVTVQISYEGANPEQIDNQITRKVEEAVGESKGVRHITSVSKEGYAEIGIEFNLEINAAEATQDVRDKLSAVRNELPTGISEPVVARYDMHAEPVAAVVLTSEDLNQRELSILVEDQIKSALQQIPGVGKLSIYGNEDREIHLLLRPESLRAFSLSPTEVSEKISNSIKEMPGGNFENKNSRLSVITKVSISNPQNFSDLMIAERNNYPIYFRQIGEVKDTVKDRTAIARYDGQQAIGIEVGKQSGANAVKVASAVRSELEKIRENLPENVSLHLIRDDAERIQESINDVWLNLILGSIFAVLVVLLFLGDVRSTIISALTIPTALTSAFFFMNLAGFTLNTMSMLGLSLAIGLLIDDAIVVIENIIRHRQQGKNPKKAAADGTKEIILAVMATSFSIIAVFLPMGFMSGITGEFFKEFGLTIVFAVVISLFISFTLTPMLASKFLTDVSDERSFEKFGERSAEKFGERSKENFFHRQQKIFSSWFDNIAEHYGKLLETILEQHRKKASFLAVGLFFGSLTLLPFLGMDMMPATDKDQFTVKYEVYEGMTLEAKDKLSQKMTRILLDIAGVKHVYATNSTSDEQTFFVTLENKKHRSKSQSEIISEIRQKLNSLPGVYISVEGLSEMGSKPVGISIKGTDFNSLGEASEKIITLLNNMPGVIDITSSYRANNPRLSIFIKDGRAYDLNVSNDAIGTTINTLLEGTKVGKFNDSDEQIDVRLRLSDIGREKPSNLNLIEVPTSRTNENGIIQLVPLSSVAEWKFDTAPSAVNRYDRQREIRISANLEGLSLGEFETKFEQETENLELPNGTYLDNAGEADDMDSMMNDMMTALILAVAFIFMILAAQFESWSEPFTIITALPLAFIGALLGLLLFNSQLSMISGIGILLLMGLVTKNAILLIDFAKNKIAEGSSCNSALISAGRIRFRPILMTTLAMILGMMPLAFSVGPGAEARAPMAHAILGGLITSTLLTLIVIPCLYSLLYDFMNRRKTFDRV